MAQITKRGFIAAYRRMDQVERERVKTHFTDMYSSAMFPDTFQFAERRLMWIREAENGSRKGASK